MDLSNLEKQNLPEEPRFLDFPHLPDDATTSDGQPKLNKYSSTITRNHDFPGAQVWLSCCCLKLPVADAIAGNALRSWGAK